MGKDIIVGLDIGTTKIACFIGQRADDGKIRIIGFGRVESKGVERGVVRNIKDTAASIESAVSIASEQAGVSVEEVYVGIAGQHIKSIQNIGTIVIPSEHKYIEQEDVDRLIEEQHGIALPAGEDIIHVFPQNYVVDGEELGPDVAPVGVAGKQLKSNFHIVTGNTTSLNNIYESVSRAGLTIKNVVLEPIASALATLDDTDREAGVAMVD
ncbi:MAG: cell division protein FtsA, partial [Bacteroidales bacterium]|nr:cell division protein FtsA [Bacteroidales bacterium]